MYSSQEDLKQLTDPQKVQVDLTYRGPHINFPMGREDISSLIEGFKNKKVSWRRRTAEERESIGGSEQ